MNKNLLINEPPLQALPSLAVKIGLNNAIVLQQLHYWVRNQKNAGRMHEGYKWVYNSYDQWQAENFPFWSVDTVRRAFLDLEKQGLVVACQIDRHKRDMTKYYRIDYDALDNIKSPINAKCTDALMQNAQMQDSKMHRCKIAKCTDVNIESETTAETTAEKKESEKNEIEKLHSLLSEWGVYKPLWDEIGRKITDDGWTVDDVVAVKKWAQTGRYGVGAFVTRVREGKAPDKYYPVEYVPRPAPDAQAHTATTDETFDKLARALKPEITQTVYRRYVEAVHSAAWTDDGLIITAPADVLDYWQNRIEPYAIHILNGITGADAKIKYIDQKQERNNG